MIVILLILLLDVTLLELVITSKRIDDGSARTIDSCDKAIGKCSNTPISFDDGIGCPTDACDAKKGCRPKLLL
jgi:hypothetical protein